MHSNERGEARGVDGEFAIRDAVVVPRPLISRELVGGGLLEGRSGLYVLGAPGLVRFFAWEE